MDESISNSNQVRGYLALPEASQAPGVLVLHAWWGLTSVFQEVCDRLAKEGFAALAPDLYGGPTASTIPDAEKLMEASDSRAIETIITSSFDFLHAHPRLNGGKLGVLGFSMGGAWAMRLAALLRPAETAAAVTFYGLDTSLEVDALSQSSAAYLGHFAEIDAYESVESVYEMEARIQAAGRPARFYVYPGVQHWFFERNRPDAYDPDTAHLAWERTVAFFKEHLG
jgi:carboxymethylenebutenolidase